MGLNTLKNSFSIFLITVFSIQTFPFGWELILFDKKTSIENIAKLISQDDKDEEESSKKSLNEDQPLLAHENLKLNSTLHFIKNNKHYPIYLTRMIPFVHIEILSPPPDVLS